jgi:hypothetical protein
VARDLGAYVCFEDEAGQGRGRRRAAPGRRGARPVVRVRGACGGRVSIAGVACYRPGDRPHLFYKLLVYRRRKGEAKGFRPQNRTLVNAYITSSTWLVRGLALGRDEGDDFEFDVNRGPYQRADD